MNNAMPKLETGMIVEVKNHAYNDTRVGLVINNSIMYIINSDGFDNVCDGRADFSTSYVSKIYSGFYSYSIYFITYLYKSGDISKFLIWEKEDTLEVTMEEVCEKFGCKVKIVTTKCPVCERIIEMAKLAVQEAEKQERSENDQL